jgi:nicotinamidase-related amidase
MLTADDAVLNVIDIQGRLATLMHRREELFASAARMIKACDVLGVPIIWNEQLPDKLGETAPEIKSTLEGRQPIIKPCFSCCGHPPFNEQLSKLDRRQVILAGIETHICVYQTARDLVKGGFEVHVLADAVSSRSELNYRVGLDRMRHEGAVISCVEMALFEMMGTAGTEMFRQVVKILK